MERKSWNQYFMDIAEVVASRSTCSRASVGSVFIKDRRILTTGYNGSPSGFRHCEHIIVKEQFKDKEFITNDITDLIDGHCWKSVHSETNAIIQSAIIGISLQGATLYCTHFPCLNCAKSLRQLNLEMVYYKHEYGITKEAQEMLGQYCQLGE